MISLAGVENRYPDFMLPIIYYGKFVYLAVFNQKLTVNIFLESHASFLKMT